MDNFGQLQPTGEEPIGHGEEDDLFDEVDMDETTQNDQLAAKSSRFLRRLNKSLHTMVGSIMEKSLKRLHKVENETVKSPVNHCLM